MCEFKVGDKVKLKSGNTFPNEKHITEILKIEADRVYLNCSESKSLCHLNQIELAYPNPPNKHRDLITEWANGADIQVWAGNDWLDVALPNWYETRKYRVKPQKSERDIEIESIQKQMDELKERLERLKGEPQSTL